MNFKTAAVQRLPEETFLYLFSLSTQQQKFLDKSNVKAFADDCIKKTQKLKFVYLSEVTIEGNEENAAY